MASVTLGHVKVGGCSASSRGPRFDLPPICAQPTTSTAAIRCCLRTRIPGSIDRQCLARRGAHQSVGFCNSVDGPRCPRGGSRMSLLAPRTFAAGANSANATWREATAECAAHGRVLCSHNELASACCCRQGCQFDTQLVWTRTPCQMPHEATRGRIPVTADDGGSPLAMQPRCNSTNATQHAEPRWTSARARYLLDVHRRWQDRLHVAHVRFGEYNGCHRRTADGGVLWLHMFGHMRESARFQLYSNWKAFLTSSHACFFIALVTRSETRDETRGGAKGPACSVGRHNAEAIAHVGAIYERLGTNFAYTAHTRGGSGPCYCVSRCTKSGLNCHPGRSDWPNCNTDWHVTAALFGGHVARAHGIPTRQNDIVIMARPDSWLTRSLDYASLTAHVRATRRQLLVGFQHDGDGMADNFYVHTRGVVEDLCVRNFDTPAGPGHPAGCPMCYGTHDANVWGQPGGPQPWACGGEMNSLALAASNAGTQTLLVREGGGLGLCLVDKVASARANRCRVVENPSALEGYADGCTPGPTTVCGPPARLFDGKLVSLSASDERGNLACNPNAGAIPRPKARGNASFLWRGNEGVAFFFRLYHQS